ncbi:MAG: ATP-binding protein [Solobacterium sp.]|nr:ATP-binding protein [Solobacterium sp.]
MLERTIIVQIKESIKHFPVTIVSGPRQVGKSTLLYHEMVKEGYTYISLDDRQNRMNAINDPVSFLDNLSYPVIIDECQRAKELFIEIEAIVNKIRLEKGSNAANGMFILSGSSSKALLENAKETMAGRCNILKMNPLSIREILQLKERPFDIDKKISPNRSNDYSLNNNQLLEYILIGGMPQFYDDSNTPRNQYFSSYIETYINVDLPEVLGVKNEKQFNDFLTLIASNTGQELIYDTIAKQTGVKSPTIKQWISALEKTGIIWLARPYNEQSIVKQVTKRPKIYFFDTGLASYLCGINDVATLDISFLKGRFIETLIANEIRKSYTNFGLNQPINYYRDNNQKEIDLVILKDGKLMLIECKSGQNYNIKDVSSFSAMDDTKYRKGTNAIICTTNKYYSIGNNEIVLPISSI